MALESIQPLADLAANDNIAIKTMATVLYCAAVIIAGLCAYIIFQGKMHREDVKQLTASHEAGEKEAWSHVSKISEAIKSFSEKVTYALGKADGRRSRED